MSTYIQGVTDYIPQVQPFVPDYNFYSGALDLRQGKQDAARKQLSTLYGSLLNAPMSRADNTEARDKFFKTIDQDIKKMAGMDLSLAQNSEAAVDIFNQMLDNKSLVKDIVWTKNFQSQQTRSAGFKNCVDPEKCGGQWWEGGDRLLGYQREKFVNATKEDAMRMGNANYVPYQDITAKALKLAKEADLNVSVDNLTGQWITTTKNGPNVIAPLESLFMGSIGKDPKVQEYYRAKASLDKEDWVHTNIAEYGSVENAEQAYMAEMTPALEKMLGVRELKEEDELEGVRAKKEKLAKAAKKAPADERTKIQQLLDKYNGIEDQTQSSLDQTKEANGNVQVAKRNQKFTPDGFANAMAMAELGQDIGRSAQILAYRNYEQSIKVNPYSLEKVKFDNRMLLQEAKMLGDLKVEELKAKLKSNGGVESNVPRSVDIEGGTSVGNLDPDSEEYKKRGSIAFEKGRDTYVNDISGNERNILNSVTSRIIAAADSNDRAAKEDYVRLFEAYVNASRQQGEVTSIADTDPYRGKALPESKRFKFTKEYQDAVGIEDKYRIARRHGFDLNELGGPQIDLIYDEFENSMNQNDVSNRYERDYLKATWEKTAAQRRVIKSKGELLSQMDQWYGEEAKNVAKRAASTQEFGPKWADAFESYIDNKGHIVGEEQFVANMMKKNYSEDVARSLYKGDTEDPTGPNAMRIWANEVSFFGFGGDQEEARNLTDQAKFAGKGVHDMWPIAFSKFAEPKGEQTLHQIVGAGDEASKGQQYFVDAAAYNSTGTKGTIGFLEDAINSKEALFSLGGFASTLPEESMDEAKAAAKVLLEGLYLDKKSASRPLITVTHSNIAGGDSDMAGLHIVLNEAYRNKFKGSANNPGVMGDALELASKGFTVYLPDSETTNILTTSTQTNHLENLMNWKGKIDFDSYPEAKDWQIALNESTGMYETTGQYQYVDPQTGEVKFNDYYDADFASSRLQDLVTKTDNLLATVALKNRQDLAKFNRNK